MNGHELCNVKRLTCKQRAVWISCYQGVCILCHQVIRISHGRVSGFQGRGLLLPLPPEGTVATSPMPGILMLRPVFTRCPSVGFSRQFKPSRLRAIRERKRELKK